MTERAHLLIGEVAGRSRLPVSTLRYHDRIGLLRPAVVDPASGYRRAAIGRSGATAGAGPVIERYVGLDEPAAPAREIRVFVPASAEDDRRTLMMEGRPPAPSLYGAGRATQGWRPCVARPIHRPRRRADARPVGLGTSVGAARDRPARQRHE